MAQKVLKNGAIYDTDKKRIVAVKPELAEKNTQITSENARALQARRQEIARERVIAGANAAVAAHPDFGAVFDGADLDFVEAGAQAVMSKALDRLDPKQVDAWRAVLQEAGISAKQPQTQTPGVTLHIGADALQALASWIGGDNSNYRKHEVIDAIPAEEADDDADAAPTTQEKR